MVSERELENYDIEGVLLRKQARNVIQQLPPTTRLTDLYIWKKAPAISEWKKFMKSTSPVDRPRISKSLGYLIRDYGGLEWTLEDIFGSEEIQSQIREMPYGIQNLFKIEQE